MIAPIICCGLLQVETFGQEFGIKLLHEFDPTGRAAGKHRQGAPGLDPVSQFRSLFHDGKVGGKRSVEHAVEPDAPECGNHFAIDVLAGFHSKFLSQGYGNRRRMLDNHELLRIRERGNHIVDIRTLREGAGWTSDNALPAIDAARYI